MDVSVIILHKRNLRRPMSKPQFIFPYLAPVLDITFKVLSVQEIVGVLIVNLQEGHKAAIFNVRSLFNLIK